jgi:hypothetical protein
MSTPLAKGGDSAFRSMAIAVSICPPPLAVVGGSRSLGLSLGGDEVHHQDPLYLDLELMPRRLVQLGRGGRLLFGKLVSPLCCLTLGIGLLSMGSRLLPLPKSASLLKEEACVRLRRQHLWWNHSHGLSGRNVF